jgi:hypothetical protein
VSWNSKHKRWYAVIKINGKKKWLGSFQTIEEAEKAVIEARKEFMPFSEETISND